MNIRRGKGRGWAYVGLVLGGAVSIAGNVTHTVLIPSPIALWLRVPLAVAWPVFLAVGIEILTRVPWRRNWRHWIIRVVGVLPIAATAAIVSFDHLHSLMLTSGETRLVSIAGPVAIDGLMVMSAFALLLTMSNVQDTSGRTLAERVQDIRTSALAVRDAARGNVQDTPDTSTPDVQNANVPDVQDGPDIKPARTPRTRGTRRGWDMDEARRLISDTLLTDAQIAAQVSANPDSPISYKTIYRLRKEMQPVLPVQDTPSL